jgi:hypothetical protein
LCKHIAELVAWMFGFKWKNMKNLIICSQLRIYCGR